jgi:glycosyltransferase involved in cell wall biosynthesis
MPERKIVVLPHFIPDVVQEPVTDTETDEQPFALAMSVLSEEKGTNDLVGIFDTLPVSLVLAGKQEDGFVLHEGKNVSTVGQKSKTELASLVRRASCIVSASRLPETFGLIALESIASGKPFFGIASGAYPEIIKNGENGILASDIAGLRRALDGFFSGTLVFDVSKIRTKALDRFGEDRYMDVLESSFAAVA